MLGPPLKLLIDCIGIRSPSQLGIGQSQRTHKPWMSTRNRQGRFPKSGRFLVAFLGVKGGEQSPARGETVRLELQGRLRHADGLIQLSRGDIQACQQRFYPSREWVRFDDLDRMRKSFLKS